MAKSKRRMAIISAARGQLGERPEPVARMTPPPPPAPPKPKPAPTVRADPSAPHVLTEAQRARQRRKRAKRLARQAVPLLPQVPSLLERLQEFYPVAFARVPVPLAIGIDKQIIAAALDDCPADVLHHALHHWTRSDLYLAILAAGGARYGLDGTPQGEVSEADRTAASTDLAARKAKQEAEHKARMMRVA